MRRWPRTVSLPKDQSTAAYGQIGTAIDYRIRYHFAITPSTELVAPRGAVWVIRDLHPPPEVRSPISIPEDSKLSKACVEGFFRTLEQIVAVISPDRRLPKDEEEEILARFCLVLAAFEAVRRAGPRAWPPPYFGGALPESEADLLALVPDDWVEDAAALGAAFAKQYPSWHGANATLNPTFAGSAHIGGADADLIVDGCLWEIKTSKQPQGQGEWLRQLLGYVLLDYDDERAIERVGLLLPRQNRRVSWPIRKLVADMSGRDDLTLQNLRKSFREICESLDSSERSSR